LDDAHHQPHAPLRGDDAQPPGAGSWELLLRHRDVALAVLLRKTGSLAEAEDSVQEAIARLGRRADLDAGRARALLIRTAKGIADDNRRAAARERAAVVRLAGSAAAEIVTPEELAGQSAEAARVLAALEQLPRRERQVLRLQLAGLSVAEIAARVGISYKSVEGALTRARARVRLILGSMLAWLAERLRRAGSSRGETAATTVAALLLLLPSLHPGLDRHKRAHRPATTPPQLAVAPAPPGGFPAMAPAHPPRHDDMWLPPSRPAPAPAPARSPESHTPAPYDPVIIDTGKIDIPGVIQWRVRVHGAPVPSDFLTPDPWVSCVRRANPSPSSGGLC
jgi:RNA polymerase sigma factor (sigma-70 family)